MPTATRILIMSSTAGEHARLDAALRPHVAEARWVAPPSDAGPLPDALLDGFDALFVCVPDSAHAPPLLDRFRRDGVKSPMVVLAPDADADAVDRCMNAGAADCLDLADASPQRMALALRLAKAQRRAEIAEQRLASSQKQLYQILETDADAIVIVGLDEQFLFANSAAARLFGVSIEEILATRHQDTPWRRYRLDGSECPDEERPFREVLRTGQSVVDAELEIARPDGSRVTTSINASPLLDASRQLQGVVIFLRDITSRHLAEKALRRSEARFRRLYEANVVGIFFWSTQGPITDANDEFLRMVGYTRHDLLEGRVNWAEMTPAEYRHLDARGLEELRKTGVCRAFAKEYIRKDGSRIPILIGAAHMEPGRSDGICWVVDLSDRQRVQEALRERDAQLRSLVENLPFDCWARDASGRGVLQNAQSRFLWGDLLDLPPDQAAVDPDVIEDWTSNNQRAMAGEVVRKERVYRIGQEERTFYCIIAPIREGDHIRGLVGANIDITDLKRAEAALRDSQALLQQFMGRSPIAAYMKDEQGRFIYVNDTMARAFGRPREEWIGRTAQQVWPGLLGERTEAASRAVLSGGQPAETVESYPHADGEHAWLVYRYPLTDAHGQRVLAALGVDVTERRRSEDRLREAEQRYRTMFEQSQHGVLIVDPSSTAILDCNTAAHRQLGYDREEFIGMGVAGIEAAETPDQIRARQQRIMREGSDEFETRLRTRSGEARDTLVTIRRITIGGRALLHVVLQDIHERNRLKEQLLQSQKMEAIGRLAGGVAHDFNNLLAVISGYSESLSRRLEADSPLRMHAQEIQRAAERGGALTRQLLAFSRRQIVRPQHLDVNRIIANLHEMLRRLLPHEVDLVIRPDPELPGVRADHGQMEQVVINLAINARDAMPSGGRLTIETHRRTLAEADAARSGVPAGEYAELTVSDTGMGMDAATAARVFEPFFTTKEGNGTGLGLSIVYGIVQQAAGSISVRSQPAQGATFTILFPAAPTPEA